MNWRRMWSERLQIVEPRCHVSVSLQFFMCSQSQCCTCMLALYHLNHNISLAFRVTKFKLERSQYGGIIRSKYGDFNYFINYILLNFLLHFLNFFCYMFDRVEIHGVQFLHINYQCFLSANLISSPLHSFRMRITFSLPKEGQWCPNRGSLI